MLVLDVGRKKLKSILGNEGQHNRFKRISFTNPQQQPTRRMSSVSPMSESSSSSSSKDIVADIIAAANVSKRSKKTTEKKPKKTAEEKPIEDNPAEDNPAEEKPKKPRKTSKKSAEIPIVAEEKPAEEKPKKSKKTSKKTSETPIVEEKPAEEKPAKESVSYQSSDDDMDLFAEEDLVVVENTVVVANDNSQLNKKTVAELKALCKTRDIKVSSKAKKDDLIKALTEASDKQDEQPVLTQASSCVPEYSKMTVAELKALCKERNIHVQSKMKKEELIAKLNRPKTPILEDNDDDVEAAPQVVEEVVVACVNYNKMTVAELKSLCKERNLKVDSKAKKADLIALLEQNQSQSQQETVGVNVSTNTNDIVAEIIESASYNELTLYELKNICEGRYIDYPSKCKKQELIRLINENDKQAEKYYAMSRDELEQLYKKRNITFTCNNDEDFVQALVYADNHPTEVAVEKPESQVHNDKVGVVDYSKKTVAELKSLCKEKNLKHDSKAKKADLIALLDASASVAAPEPVAAPSSDKSKPESKKTRSDSKKNEPKNTDKKVEQVDIEVVFYEDGKRLKFDQMSGNQLESVNHAITDIIDVHNDDVVYRGEDDAYMIVKNVKKEDDAICGKHKKYGFNEKHQVRVQQYSVHAWGKIEMKFIELKNYVKMTITELRSMCSRVGINHYSKSKSELVSLLENASMSNDDEEVVSEEVVQENVEVEGDDDYVEKQTVLFEYDGEKYWMDTEESSNGVHDIYSYDSLEHIGFYDKAKNTLMHIDA